MSEDGQYNGKVIFHTMCYIPNSSVSVSGQFRIPSQRKGEMCYGMTFVLVRENERHSIENTFGELLQGRGLVLQKYTLTSVMIGSASGQMETGRAVFPEHILEGLIQDTQQTANSQYINFLQIVEQSMQRWSDEGLIDILLENKHEKKTTLDLLTAMLIIGELTWDSQGIDYAIGTVHRLIRERKWDLLQTRIKEAEKVREMYNIHPIQEDIHEIRYNPDKEQIKKLFSGCLEERRILLEEEVRTIRVISVPLQEALCPASKGECKRMTGYELTEWFHDKIGTTPEGRAGGISNAPGDHTHPTE